VGVPHPKINDAFFQKTGKKDLYYNLNFNPHCPEIPGAPGLLFNLACFSDLNEDSNSNSDEDEDEGGDSDSDEDEGDGDDSDANDEEEEEKKPETKDSEKKVEKKKDMEGSWILFSRLDTKIWQYQGQYITASAQPLKVAEWKQQSRKVFFLSFFL
jgi:hypothetical protein